MRNFKDKVIYQIYPKSFQDTTGNGFGDLKGVTSRLNYLQELGVDYIWLTPFFTSPQRDNGYDVADYCNIEPLFGTMADCEELIQEASKRGIDIMLDMVFNHTSTEHEWFQKALAGDPNYMDYYIFKDGVPDEVPTNWESKFGGNAWEYVPHLKKWYLHLFDVTQADLNWENPKVREELKEIIKFWKNKGVKGFRFDVVNLISKPEVFENDTVGDGRRFYTDGRNVHRYLKELVADTQIEEMVTVGEMSSTTLEQCKRYSHPSEKELSMCFNFHHLKVDYKNGDKWEPMPPDFNALKELFYNWQVGMQEHEGWNALFWCNHDQPRAVSRLGDDKTYWKESAKMLATCIHMMQGTPYIYQGEEIGMTNAKYTDISQYRDVESKNYYEIMLRNGKTKEEALIILGTRSRDNARTPMQWNRCDNAGFSKSIPWISIPENYKVINVEVERNDVDSILEYYKKLIQIRKKYHAISEGKIEFIYDVHPEVFAYKRTCGDEEILVLNNLGKNAVEITIDLQLESYKKILGNYGEAENIRELAPFEAVVYLR